MTNVDPIPSSSALRAAHLIERLGRVLRAADHATALNPAQCEALRYLARANRFSRTPAALAEYLGTTRGTVSQTLLALEAKGLLEKHANTRDGRSVVLALTAAGAAFLSADPVHVLARALDSSGTGSEVVAVLEAGLRSAIADRRGRAFGACHTCMHFQANQHLGGPPHHCALLNEPLTIDDAQLICAEQVA